MAREVINRQEWLDDYESGLSTRQIAAKYGVSKSQVYKVIKRCGLARGQSEAAILRQPQLSTHWRTTRSNARKLWQRTYGEIPEGYHIHHKDGDPTNNSLDNLEMIDGREHISRHNRGPEYGIPPHLREGHQEYMREYLKAYRKTYRRKRGQK